MKQAKLTGFPNYTICDNGDILDANGKKLKPNKSGKVTMECTEEAEGLEVGKKYPMTPSELVKICSDADAFEVVEDENAGAGAEMPKEETPEEKAKREIKEKGKELRKALKEAQDAVLEAAMSGDAKKAQSASEKMKEANDAYEAFKSEHGARQTEPKELTDEQKQLNADFEAAKESYAGILEVAESAKEEYEKALEAVKGFRRVKKEERIAGISAGNRAPHLSYDIAQEIRKKISEGAKPSDVADEYGCTVAAIRYITNYLQHKLKKGDTAYTPLVNDFYNEKSGWANGAPYAEDGIKETNERYLLPESRKNKSARVSDLPKE